MTGLFSTPALQCFLERLGSELVWGEVLVRRVDSGFELRHVVDRLASDLTELSLSTIRSWAQSSGDGQFRPLKSAPNLRPGWRLRTATGAELEYSLNALYPGALADWFSNQHAGSPPVSYHDFTARQTGIYRKTAALAEPEVTDLVRACCDQDLCLKRRLWIAPGLREETASEKSLLPCLEPCALLLDFARASTQFAQDESSLASLSGEELTSLQRVLRQPRQESDSAQAGGRVADFSDPENPRRRRWRFHRVEMLLQKKKEPNET